MSFLYHEISLVIHSIVFVFILGFLQVLPLVLESYVPMVLPYYLYPTMMMIGFQHMVNSTKYHIAALVFHFLFSLFSIFTLILFLIESVRPVDEMFDGSISYSFLAGSLSELIITTSTLSSGELGSPWLILFQVFDGILLGISIIHLVVCIHSFITKTQKVKVQSEIDTNTKKDNVEEAEEDNFIFMIGEFSVRHATMIFSGLGFALGFSQACIGYFLESNSLIILNPTYNGNMVLIFCFTAYFMIPLPSSKVVKDSYKHRVFMTSDVSEYGIMIFGRVSSKRAAVFIMGAILFYFGILLSLWNIIQQQYWFTGDGNDMTMFNVTGMQHRLYIGDPFQFNCTNTKTLEYTSENNATIAIWTNIDSIYSCFYIFLGTFCAIFYTVYLYYIFQLVHQSTTTEDGHEFKFSSKIMVRGVKTVKPEQVTWHRQ